ncbi:MFS transporter [Acidicapsa dinghuensis]|uniref:MFS transporter n=1 Tax=Acidicapsa dinghuensis TaxID=2218256 RepID=A0ABW1EGI8_9BACT|nr:MFS transporter [Acidicapsa dinghuensis]
MSDRTPQSAFFDRAKKPPATEKKQSRRAVEVSNFFLADVQTGLGPFLAAYLAAAHWRPDQVGLALTVGGVITVVVQTPAGSFVDRVHAKRALLIAGSLVLAVGAVLLSLSTDQWAVFIAQVLIGSAAPFLAPTLAAITMGLTGPERFDIQFGRNQSFNSAGNVASAGLIAAISRWFGNRAIFLATALFTIPTVVSILMIRSQDIHHTLARGGREQCDEEPQQTESITQVLLSDRVLLAFLVASSCFHLANAAMLPELGEMLNHGSSTTAAPFMSACVLVTQIVIMCSAAFLGRAANRIGRRPLLLLGFGVLPFRAVLYTLTHATVLLVAIQVLDGVANAIFTVVSVLLVADRTRGSGRFNLAQGALATAVGIGAALSNLIGGKLAQECGFNRSFLGLGVIAVIALLLVWAFVPETLSRVQSASASRSQPAR